MVWRKSNKDLGFPHFDKIIEGVEGLYESGDTYLICLRLI